MLRPFARRETAVTAAASAGAQGMQAMEPVSNQARRSSEAFDRFARLTGRLFGVPMALLTLSEANRRWSAGIGLPATQAPSLAFCEHAARSGGVTVVPDATQDPRFAAHPLVMGPPHIRFYAGAPLIAAGGQAIGTLSVFDDKPRRLPIEDQQLLQDLASMAAGELELRGQVGRVEAASGLPNRHRFAEDLEGQALGWPRGRMLCVLVDAGEPDRIEPVLRLFGPGAGDALARTLGELVRDALGTAAPLYQVDPLRFACILEDGDAFAWHRVVERLVARMRGPLDCAGIPVALSPGVGVVAFRMNGMPARELLRRAIAAAAAARGTAAGWAVHDPRSEQSRQRELTLLADLRGALARPDGLSLVYQPRVDLRTGACTGAEALLRWQHPTLGAIEAAELVALAGQTALMVPLTDWVIETALAQLVEWRAAGLALRVSLNVAAADFMDGRLAGRIGAALRLHALPADALEVEFTEAALRQGGEAAQLALRELRTLGVELALDDWGGTQSGLAVLQSVPARVAKLDQGLVKSLAGSRPDRTIVQALIRTAHEFGYRLVAEGVESPEIRDFVAGWGCDEAQGYSIARPMEPAALGRWVNRGRLAALAPTLLAPAPLLVEA
ncbi:MAG: GGDEF and EAL domain-containing protein [Acidisphaera sp.]|nr:GGDEF and EAL domain-containing protein [Acidisphaera sp.]